MLEIEKKQHLLLHLEILDSLNHQNPSKPIKTQQNPSKSNKTQQNPSKMHIEEKQTYSMVKACERECPTEPPIRRAVLLKFLNVSLFILNNLTGGSTQKSEGKKYPVDKGQQNQQCANFATESGCAPV